MRDAASSLRHGLEYFFHFVADAIRACPPYSLSGQYDMGQMFNACNSKRKTLIKTARKAAESWGQEDAVEKIEQFHKRRNAALASVNAQQWAINPNVHFNKWMNMSSDEFRPVLDAFDNVCGLFQCSDCNAICSVVQSNLDEVQLKCKCGNTCWNLEKQAS